MAKIDLPIPQTITNGLRALFDQSVLTVVWFVFVTVLVVVTFYALVALGPIGQVIAGVLIGTIASDTIRSIYWDIARMRFTEVELPWP